jgi:hypothetical protein
MELNKEKRIERFIEQMEILNILINLEDWVKYYLDLYFSFELMANYITETIQLNNLINNELYTISKKLSKLLAKEDLTYYVQERHRYPNITKLIKEIKDSGVDSFHKDSFYKETIAEFYIIIDLVEIDIEDIDLYIENINELKEDGVKPENINGIIKKLHPTLINTFKILAYLDYLNFLKIIEKKPEIVEKELKLKTVNSNFKIKEEKKKDPPPPKKTPNILNPQIDNLFYKLEREGCINCKKPAFNKLFNGTEIDKITDKIIWHDSIGLLKAIFKELKINFDNKIKNEHYYKECFQFTTSQYNNNKITPTNIKKAKELLKL